MSEFTSQIQTLLQTQQIFSQETVSIEHLQYSSQILGNLRAQLAQKENQETIRQCIQQQSFNIYTFYIQFLNNLETLQKIDQKSCDQITSFTLQFITNFITANQTNKDYFFENILQQDQNIQQIYSSFKNDYKYLKFITIFLHNFLKDHENPQNLPQFLKNTNTKTLLKIIFTEYLGTTHTEIQYEQNSQINQFYDWVLNLLCQLFTQNYQQNNENNNFSPYKFLRYELFESNEKLGEQLYELFIQIFQKFTDDKVQFTHLKDHEPTNMDIRCNYINYISYMFKFTLKDFEFIQENLIQHTENMIQLIQQNLKSIENDTLDPQIKLEINLHLKPLFESIKLLCLITFLGGYNVSIQTQILSFNQNSTLKALLDLLKTFRKLNTVSQEVVEAIIKKKQLVQQEIQRENQETNTILEEDLTDEELKNLQNSNKELKQEFLDEMKQVQKELNQRKQKMFQKVFDSLLSQELFSCTLRLMSNIVHINREAQDYISNNNYLKDCLSFSSGMELNDPLAREWSIVLIRNLCDSNDEIQDKIAQMKVMHFDEKLKDVVNKYQLKREQLANLAENLTPEQLQNLSIQQQDQELQQQIQQQLNQNNNGTDGGGQNQK